MLSNRTAVAALAAVLVVQSGCTLFPPDPIVLEPSDDGGGIDSGTPNFATADVCSDSLSLSTASDTPELVSFASATDTTGPDLVSCGAADIAGPEIFVRFQAQGGDRWFIHAEPDPGSGDVAIHVSPNCDTSACFAFQNTCSEGLAEGYNFVAPAAGVFGVGVERVSGAGDAQLLLQRLVCGNGVREEGESCEDGNTADGDGCSAVCLTELGDGALEVEPNGNLNAANVIRRGAPTGTTAVLGNLGGTCDVDVYQVTLDANQSLAVTMLDGSPGGGSPCSDQVPAVTMILVNEQGAPVVTGAPNAPINECPLFEAQELPQGTYRLMLFATEGANILPYRLNFVIEDVDV